MTLVARNEADIVDAQIAFHLSAGVDFVIATDNDSGDGTTEILERYERLGVLRLVREKAGILRQGDWVTRMARLAATEHEADWVINSDADEFWWPRGGSLKEVLSAVPPRFGVIRGAWRHFLPTTRSDSFFAERMTVRLTTPAFPGDKATVYHAHQKVAHRAHSRVLVDEGNHDVRAPGLEPIRGWHPLEVLHFSFRSLQQFERKSTEAFERRARMGLGGPTLHHVLAYEACRAGRAQEYYAKLVVDESALEQGLAQGTMAIDTRLRDALRELRREDGLFPSPGDVRALTFSPSDPRDAAEYAAEVSRLVEIDGIVRGEQRVEEIEDRVGALERGGLRRLGAFVRGAGESVSRRRLARR
jgi:hypothetical protein